MCFYAILCFLCLICVYDIFVWKSLFFEHKHCFIWTEVLLLIPCNNISVLRFSNFLLKLPYPIYQINRLIRFCMRYANCFFAYWGQMLSECNIMKNLLFLVLENFVELLMSNIYLRSHNPEKGNNTLWDFKFDQIGFQTFISESLVFGSSMREYHAQKKLICFK